MRQRYSSYSRCILPRTRSLLNHDRMSPVVVSCEQGVRKVNRNANQFREASNIQRVMQEVQCRPRKFTRLRSDSHTYRNLNKSKVRKAQSSRLRPPVVNRVPTQTRSRLNHVVRNRARPNFSKTRTAISAVTARYPAACYDVAIIALLAPKFVSISV